MDQVEFVLVEPDIFGIIDDELEIGRHTEEVSCLSNHTRLGDSLQCGLAWTEVNTNDLAFRMLISWMAS